MKKNIFPFILIAVVTALIYGRMLDNFFYYDDFKWLDDVQNLDQNPLSIFNPIVHPQSDSLTSHAVSYFTPVVYIVYWINYKIFGLNPFGYHLLNLFLHILNSYLVVYFVFLLRRDLPLATLVGLLFASSFVITEAVIWSGGYVDTVMFFFYILSLIVFLQFILRGNYHYYLLSILLFILGLSAKGTALTLPLALLFVEIFCTSPKRSFKRLEKYIPFLIIAATYLFLSQYKTASSGLTSGHTVGYIDIEQIALNAIKIPMTVFIPEAFLPAKFLPAFACLTLLSIFILMEMKRDRSRAGFLGILIMLVGIFPLLLIHWEFPVNPDPLTHSIRHRLYLGSLGTALFLGSVFYRHYTSSTRVISKGLAGLMIIAFISINVYWNNEIQAKWEKITGDTQSALNEFNKVVVKYPPGSAIYFINFPPNQGFANYFYKLYIEHPNLTVSEWPTEPHTDRIEFFYLHLNGHLYDDPDAAVSMAFTPWEHFFVAQFYLLKGEKIKGIAELEKATFLISDEKLHLLAANCYQKLGLSNKVIDEFEKVLAVNKDNIEIYSALGLLYFDTGDIDSAIKYFEKAVYLNKKDYKTAENLAQLYAGKGENDKAKAMWLLALKYEDREEFRERIKRNLDKMNQ